MAHILLPVLSLFAPLIPVEPQSKAERVPHDTIPPVKSTSQPLAAGYDPILHKVEEVDRLKVIPASTPASDAKSQVDIHRTRATENYNQGQYVSSIADWSMVIELEPKDPTAWCWRGNAWAAKGQYEEAIRDYTKAIELAPKSIEPLCIRGYVRCAKDDFENAIADYTKAHELEPTHPRPILGRGDAQFHRGELDKAIEDYTQVIKIHPLSDEAYRRRGGVRIIQHEFEKAAADFTKVLEFYPKDVSTLCWRGLAMYKCQEYAKSVADLEKAIGLDPKCAYALDSLTVHFSCCDELKLRDAKKAVEYGRKLVDLEPNVWSYRESLAIALAEAGNFQEAMEQQEIVLSDETLTEDEREYAEWAMSMYAEKKPLSGLR